MAYQLYVFEIHFEVFPSTIALNEQWNRPMSNPSHSEFYPLVTSMQTQCLVPDQASSVDDSIEVAYELSCQQYTIS